MLRDLFIRYKATLKDLEPIVISAFYSNKIIDAMKAGDRTSVSIMFDSGNYIDDERDIIMNASIYGYLNVLERTMCAYENHPTLWLFADKAAVHGHLDIVKWAHKNKYNISYDAVNNAARYGQFEVVKWLCEAGYGGTEDAMDFAAENGYLEILKVLHAHGHRCTEYASVEARSHNHMDVVDWLFDNGLYWSYAVDY